MGAIPGGISHPLDPHRHPHFALASSLNSACREIGAWDSYHGIGHINDVPYRPINVVSIDRLSRGGVVFANYAANEVRVRQEEGGIRE